MKSIGAILRPVSRRQASQAACGRRLPALGPIVLAATVLASMATAEPGVTANGIALDFGESLGPLAKLANEARVVHLKGDSPEHGELLHQARQEIIRTLQHQADFDVLVLPIGIFEGAWVNARLREGASAAEAATPVYRVWRESEEFLEILSYARENQLEIAGGLCRYHASGKELYTHHLIDFFERSDLGTRGLADRIRALWGGRSRLTAATPSHRLSALALADELVALVEGSDHRWETHFLKNMKTFAQLEMIRAEDVSEDPDFGLEEKRQNLTWFLDEAYPDAKLIYWEGRGSSSELPTDVAVFPIELAVTD